MSAKWTAVSFFGLATLGASLAAAGCSVTTGTVDNDGGGTVIIPEEDSGTTADSGGSVDAGYVNTCTANTNQTIGPIVSVQCQESIDTNCCTQLAGCFGIATPTGVDDCNKFTLCVDKCNYQADGVTPETDASKIEACQNTDCPALSQQDVVDAYDALTACIVGNASTKTACGL